MAPASVRLGLKLAQVSPGVSARVTRRLGSDEIAREFAPAQATKR